MNHRFFAVVFAVALTPLGLAGDCLALRDRSSPLVVLDTSRCSNLSPSRWVGVAGQGDEATWVITSAQTVLGIDPQCITVTFQSANGERTSTVREVIRDDSVDLARLKLAEQIMTPEFSESIADVLPMSGSLQFPNKEVRIELSGTTTRHLLGHSSSMIEARAYVREKEVIFGSPLSYSQFTCRRGESPRVFGIASRNYYTDVFPRPIFSATEAFPPDARVRPLFHGGKRILDWLAQVRKGEVFSEISRRDNGIQVGDLNLKFQCVFHPEFAQSTEGDFIGGTDPVGIGGGSIPSSPWRCSMRVTTLPGFNAIRWAEPMRPWANQGAVDTIVLRDGRRLPIQGADWILHLLRRGLVLE